MTVYLGKSGGFHREGEAFDLDCHKMNQNSSGPKDEKVFRENSEGQSGLRALRWVHYSSYFVTRMPDSPFTVVFFLCCSVVSS